MRLVFTRSARQDLLSIGDWIAVDNPRRAASFVDRVEQHCSTLARHPDAFPLVEGFEDRGIRRSVYRGYLVFYRVEPERLVVIHVLSGAMNWTAILDASL